MENTINSNNQFYFKILGLVMRTQRKKVHLTQNELAEKSNISRATITALELGKTNVSISVLLQQCDNISISLSELFARVESVVNSLKHIEGTIDELI